MGFNSPFKGLILVLVEVVLCSARQRPLRLEPGAEVANQYGYDKGAECIIFQCYTISRYCTNIYLYLTGHHYNSLPIAIRPIFLNLWIKI